MVSVSQNSTQRHMHECERCEVECYNKTGRQRKRKFDCESDCHRPRFSIFPTASTIRSRGNFSGYVPSAPSPSTLPRLPLIKNISPMRPGWIGNKHANSKRGIYFPQKLPLSSERWSQSFTTSSARRVQRIGPFACFPVDSDKERAKSSFPKQYENSPSDKTSASHGFLPLRLSINQTRACQSAEWMMILCALPLVSTPNENTTQMHKN